jgi:hypothetical protein
MREGSEIPDPEMAIEQSLFDQCACRGIGGFSSLGRALRGLSELLARINKPLAYANKFWALDFTSKVSIWLSPEVPPRSAIVNSPLGLLGNKSV